MVWCRFSLCAYEPGLIVSVRIAGLVFGKASGPIVWDMLIAESGGKGW